MRVPSCDIYRITIYTAAQTLPAADVMTSNPACPLRSLGPSGQYRIVLACPAVQGFRIIEAAVLCR